MTIHTDNITICNINIKALSENCIFREKYSNILDEKY